MFKSKLNSTPAALDGLSTRTLQASTAAAQQAAQAAAQAAQVAQAAAQTAAEGMGVAAQNAAQGAQTAAHEMGKSMRKGMVTARVWAAPRLETAADQFTETVAPRIADAMRTTARQVQPEVASKTKRNVLSLSVLGVAVLAAFGAVAALVRRQYKTAMEADTESDIMDIEDGDEPATSRPSAPAQAGSPDGSAVETRA